MSEDSPIDTSVVAKTESSPEGWRIEKRLEDIWGSLPRVTTTPTWVPRTFSEALALDTSEAALYYYDFVNNSWREVTSLQTYGEIFIPAEAMNPTTTAGCAALTKVEAGTNDVDYWVLAFDTTTEESCFFTVRMPDDWNASTVTFQFIWTNAAGLTTETVAWGIKGRCYADSDAIDQAYGSEITTSDTWLAQNDIHLSAESAAVTPAGTLAVGQWAQFKISRKTGSDNMTGDVRLLGVRLKYTRV